MKKNRYYFIIILLLSVSISYGVNANENSIEVQIATEKTCYEVDEFIYVDIKVINSSSKSYFVNNTLYERHTIKFNLYNDKGEIIPYESDWFIQYPRSSLSDYIFLCPTDYFGRSVPLNHQYNPSLSKGSYKLSVDFWVPDWYFTLLNFTSLRIGMRHRHMFWLGSTQSNTIEFDIKDSCSSE